MAASTKFVADAVKNDITEPAPDEGALVTSTSTLAPARASVRPAPVTASTPDEREAATTS